MAGERAERELIGQEVVAQEARAEKTPDEPEPDQEGRERAPWEPALRVGLSVGLVLAALNVVNWLVQLGAGGAFSNGQASDVVAQPFCGLSFFMVFALFLARLILFYVAGWRAEKRAGAISRGAVAGMVAGVVDGASGLLVTLLGIAFFPEYTLTSGFTTAARPTGESLVFPLIETVMLAGVGLLIGAIGGGASAADEYTAATRREALAARHKQ